MCFGSDLRLEVGFLRSSKNVGRGDVQMQQNLPKGRPVSGLPLPGVYMKRRKKKIRDFTINYTKKHTGASYKSKLTMFAS